MPVRRWFEGDSKEMRWGMLFINANRMLSCPKLGWLFCMVCRRLGWLGVKLNPKIGWLFLSEEGALSVSGARRHLTQEGFPFFAYLLIVYLFRMQKYISFCTLPIIVLHYLFFNRIFTITIPTFRHLPLLQSGFCRSHTGETPMRTACIIKRYRFCHLLLHLLQGGKLQLGKT